VSISFPAYIQSFSIVLPIQVLDAWSPFTKPFNRGLSTPSWFKPNHTPSHSPPTFLLPNQMCIISQLQMLVSWSKRLTWQIARTSKSTGILSQELVRWSLGTSLLPTESPWNYLYKRTSAQWFCLYVPLQRKDLMITGKSLPRLPYSTSVQTPEEWNWRDRANCP
jgi:hypothetical protein